MSTLTREQAITKFKELVKKYGLKWTAAVPAAACEEMAECNRILTTADRREALGFPR